MKRTLSWSVGLVAGLALLWSPAAHGQTANWQLQTIPPALYWSSQMAQKHADQVRELTGGKINITVYPGGSLGFKGPDTLDSISSNLMQLGEVWGSHVAGQEQIMELFELPMYIPSDFEVRKELWAALTPMYRELLDKRYGVTLITLIQNEPRMLHTKKQVVRLTDLKGMKLRAIGPVESEFTRKIGATPVPVNWTELYTALAQGVVDGNWAADLAEFATKFHEVTDYTLDPHSGGLGIFYVVNNDALAALSPEVREQFKSTWDDHTARMIESTYNGTKLGRKLIVEKGGQIVRDIHPDDRAFMMKISKPIIEDWAKRLDPESKRIYLRAKAIVDAYNARSS